jgi:hypothetical protein
MQHDIKYVSDMIADARRQLTKGETIKLATLESEVDALCQAIHRNPPQNARDIRQTLAAIVNDLDALEHELNEQHRQLEEGLAERTRKLAIEAYSDPSDPIETNEGREDRDDNGKTS